MALYGTCTVHKTIFFVDYYSNYDCRRNCQVCEYKCDPYDPACGADYDDGDQGTLIFSHKIS